MWAVGLADATFPSDSSELSPHKPLEQPTFMILLLCIVISIYFVNWLIPLVVCIYVYA